MHQNPIQSHENCSTGRRVNSQSFKVLVRHTRAHTQVTDDFRRSSLWGSLPAPRSALASAWLWGPLRRNSPCPRWSPHTAAHWGTGWAAPLRMGEGQGQSLGLRGSGRRENKHESRDYHHIRLNDETEKCWWTKTDVKKKVFLYLF